MRIIEKLRAEQGSVDVADTTQITEIAEAYLDCVGGADGFRQFTQNTGEPGPHPGPFWEQIVPVEILA